MPVHDRSNAPRRQARPVTGHQAPSAARRAWLQRGAAIAAAASVGVPAVVWPLHARAQAAPGRPLLRPPRLREGDTLALVAPSGAIYERDPVELAVESLRALGFRVREGAHLRARRGHFAGTDAERAADVQAMFADPGVHGILALTGGSGANRILQRLDYAAIARHPKFFGGFSDITALLNAIHARTGLVTFHAPVGISEWNDFSVRHLRGAVVAAEAMLLANPVDKGDAVVPRADRTVTIRPGRAGGPLVGGNLAVFASMAGSGYWPALSGAVLFLEDINEYIYRVDRMLSTLKLAGALDRLAGVVLGAFTNCGPGDGSYGTLTLDEVFDDYFGGLGVPVYRGAMIGHIRRKFTLPVGLPVEVDADAGTLRFLMPAVT